MMRRRIMRKYLSILSVVLLACSISYPCLSQQSKLDSLTRKFKNYRGSAFQEKLFVHIDQDFYLTGELLWFRVFNVDGTLHRPSSLSKVAFIEILDSNNKSLVQSKVALDENGGHGSLFIPATLNSGNYLVRVYTQWMRNFPSDFYFQKQITVVNPFLRPEGAQTKKDIDAVRIEFFPEGGNLIADVKSKVAFKVSDANGNPVNGSGVIVRNTSDTVTTFSPLKFGLGSFYISPGAGDEFRCVFTAANGAKVLSRLPEVREEGYAMQLIDSGSEVRIRIWNKRKDKASLDYTFLFAHARQSIIWAEAKPIYPDVATFAIPKSKLPDGITHFTIFDESQRPMAERLYFKAPDHRLELKLTTDQDSYTTRRKVALDLTSMYNGSTMPADVSLAVFRMDSLSSPDADNILSYLYLESDLKGKIDSAEYYFGNTREAASAADNLMLTHGWRRFNWDNILTGKADQSFIPEVRSHLITGKVTKADGTPASGILTYLSSPGKIVNVYGGRSNKDGLVHFEVRDFWGSRRLIFQTNTNRDSTYRLSINNPYDDAELSYTLPPFSIDPSQSKKLDERSLSMQVQDIFYREANNKIVSVKEDSTSFFGKADETFNLDDYTRFPVMEEVMREYVPGVMVRKRKDGFRFIVLDDLHRDVLDGEPLVLIDGMPVFDVDKVMAFDPLRVKRLEVVTRKFFVGSLIIPGIVSYSTYQGDLAGFEIDPRSVYINYEGLELQREFYSPRYENQKQRNNRLPDQRVLLHWTPQILTGTDGKSTIEFYTSDTSGEFVVVAHGLASQGAAGTSVHKFNVRRADF
jgi:hypothetical protein